MTSAPWRSISLRRGVPAYGPPRTTDWASGRSTISQLSPIGGPVGQLPPQERLEPSPAPHALLGKGHETEEILA